MVIQFAKPGKKTVAHVERSVPKAAKPTSRAPQAPKSKPQKPEKAPKPAPAPKKRIEKGRPKTADGARVAVSVRLAPATLAVFMATGPEWRAAMASILEEAARVLVSSDPSAS